WRVSSWSHCTRDAEAAAAERREDYQWVTSTRLPVAGRSETKARTSRVRSASSVRSRKNELSGAQGSAEPKARRAVSRHRHHWLERTRPTGIPLAVNAAATRCAWA